MKMSRLLSGLACCVVLLMAAQPADADGFEYSFTPYLWGVGLDGTTGVTTETDSTVVDLDAGFFDETELAIPLHFEAKGPVWTLITEVNFASITQELGSITGDGEFDMLIAELVTGWQWTESVELLFGSRYVDLDLNLQTGGVLSAADLKTDQQWVDALVGIRYAGQLNRRGNWHSSFRADVGGFGLGSDLTLNVRTLVGVDLSYTVRLMFGYHWMDIDYEDEGLQYDILQQGPEVGLTFRF